MNENNNENNIERIKQNIPLEYYLWQSGHDLKKTGNCLTTICPLCKHKDCFRVTPAKNLWKCFSCDQGGDIIELHKQLHHMTLAETIFDLCRKFNIKTDHPGHPPGKINDKTTHKKKTLEEFFGNLPGIAPVDPFDKASGKASGKTSDTSSADPSGKTSDTVLTLAATYYHRIADTAPGFQQFLKFRRFSRELATHFKLGYADGNLHRHLTEKGVSPGEMVASGLVRENKDGTLYDYFRYQVIFPTFRENEVIHIKGKGIDRSGKPTKKVWQTSHKTQRDFFFNGQNLPESGAPLFLVDGENDAVALEKINCTAWASGGNISEKQIERLQAALRAGWNIILLPDNDTAGRKMTQKLQNTLHFWTLPDTLRNLVEQGMGKVSCLRLAPDYNDIDEALRKMPETTDIKQITSPRAISPDLSGCMKYYHKTIEEREIKYSANTVGRIVFEYLAGAGSFFVIDEDIFFIHNGNQYQVGNNLPFKALLYKLGNINYADKSSKIIWESIQARCFYTAPHTEHNGWLHTDHTNPAAPAVYYNLCNPKNELIRISPGKIDKIMNGSNSKAVFLRKSPKTRPITFQYCTDPEMTTGLGLFFDLFFNNMACDLIWKMYIISLIINSVFLNMVKAHGINKFTGHQGSGKTETAGMITALLYGQNFVTVGSTASDYTDAALNPVTICDNLEIHNITPDRRDFLLCVATGITRQKRKSGTDTKNIYEKTITQIITTSIESFELPELIERAITIPFAQEHFNPDYPGAITIENQIIANRDKILSAIFKLSSHILTDFNTKKAKAYKYLEKNHKQHTKKRLNEHLSCLFVIMEAFIAAVPRAKQMFSMPTEAILSEWIHDQDTENREIMQETNIIVRYLNILADESANDNLGEYRIHNLEHHPGYAVDAVNTSELKFEASTSQLLSIFDLVAKKYNIKQRFSSARHLAVRIRNEQSIIEAAGWKISLSRRIKGQNLFEISNMGEA